jgi:hypothetical protein
MHIQSEKEYTPELKQTITGSMMAKSNH